jgi:hypothetical protein
MKVGLLLLLFLIHSKWPLLGYYRTADTTISAYYLQQQQTLNFISGFID